MKTCPELHLVRTERRQPRTGADSLTAGGEQILQNSNNVERQDQKTINFCSTLLRKNEVNEDELLSSFLKFIQPNESDSYNRLISGAFTDNDVKTISDILYEYSIFTVPTQKNITSLMKKSSRVALA